MNLRRSLGVLLIVVGGVMCLFFRDWTYAWFEGLWFGLALVALGVLDLVEDTRRRHGHRPPGIVEELRRDLGGSRESDDRRDHL